MLPEHRAQLEKGAAAWGVALTDETLERFARFAVLLEETNRAFNLTRVPPDEYATRHFLDSLALAAVWKPTPGMRLLDVGTGAGFPGLPLALAFPELDVTLLDGTLKRLRFLDSCLAELGVTNARTRHGRAEELAREAQQRGRYDLTTARAVAKLPTLAGWLLPLTKPGGLAVAYKSAEAGAEIDEARSTLARLGGRLERNAEVALPGTDIVRKLLLIRKSLPTERHGR